MNNVIHRLISFTHWHPCQDSNHNKVQHQVTNILSYFKCHRSHYQAPGFNHTIIIKYHYLLLSISLSLWWGSHACSLVKVLELGPLPLVKSMHRSANVLRCNDSKHSFDLCDKSTQSWYVVYDAKVEVCLPDEFLNPLPLDQFSNNLGFQRTLWEHTYIIAWITTRVKHSMLKVFHTKYC